MALRMDGQLRAVLAIAMTAGAAAWLFAGSGRTGPSVVVYCSHDAVFAEGILRDFERRTGIAVDVVYDTEATKSLGLVNRLLIERSRPRCDVLWNNELLGTMQLAHEGVLQPYRGSGYD